MRLNITDGQTQIQAVFAEDMDIKDCQRIRTSKRPVTTAMKIAKDRMGLEGLWFPVPGLALTGLDATG